MANYAVVRSGVVENMVVWDGVEEFAPLGCEVIEATETARIGGSWDGNVFTFVEPTPIPPTAEQVAHAENKANAKSKLAALGLSEDEISAAFGI
tara:strand:- start:227 stop:508 length:282 start_codon:yes stop_codon:yes gene_type:complete